MVFNPSAVSNQVVNPLLLGLSQQGLYVSPIQSGQNPTTSTNVTSNQNQDQQNPLSLSASILSPSNSVVLNTKPTGFINAAGANIVADNAGSANANIRTDISNPTGNIQAENAGFNATANIKTDISNPTGNIQAENAGANATANIQGSPGGGVGNGPITTSVSQASQPLTSTVNLGSGSPYGYIFNPNSGTFTPNPSNTAPGAASSESKASTESSVVSPVKTKNATISGKQIGSAGGIQQLADAIEQLGAANVAQYGYRFNSASGKYELGSPDISKPVSITVNGAQTSGVLVGSTNGQPSGAVYRLPDNTYFWKGNIYQNNPAAFTPNRANAPGAQAAQQAENPLLPNFYVAPGMSAAQSQAANLATIAKLLPPIDYVQFGTRIAGLDSTNPIFNNPQDPTAYSFTITIQGVPYTFSGNIQSGALSKQMALNQAVQSAWDTLTSAIQDKNGNLTTQYGNIQDALQQAGANAASGQGARLTSVTVDVNSNLVTPTINGVQNTSLVNSNLQNAVAFKAPVVLGPTTSTADLIKYGVIQFGQANPLTTPRIILPQGWTFDAKGNVLDQNGTLTLDEAKQYGIALLNLSTALGPQQASATPPPPTVPGNAPNWFTILSKGAPNSETEPQTFQRVGLLAALSNLGFYPGAYLQASNAPVLQGSSSNLDETQKFSTASLQGNGLGGLPKSRLSLLAPATQQEPVVNSGSTTQSNFQQGVSKGADLRGTLLSIFQPYASSLYNDISQPINNYLKDLNSPQTRLQNQILSQYIDLLRSRGNLQQAGGQNPYYLPLFSEGTSNYGINLNPQNIAASLASFPGFAQNLAANLNRNSAEAINYFTGRNIPQLIPYNPTGATIVRNQAQESPFLSAGLRAIIPGNTLSSQIGRGAASLAVTTPITALSNAFTNLGNPQTTPLQYLLNLATIASAGKAPRSSFLFGLGNELLGAGSNVVTGQPFSKNAVQNYQYGAGLALPFEGATNIGRLLSRTILPTGLEATAATIKQLVSTGVISAEEGQSALLTAANGFYETPTALGNFLTPTERYLVPPGRFLLRTAPFSALSGALGAGQTSLGGGSSTDIGKSFLENYLLAAGLQGGIERLGPILSELRARTFPAVSNYQFLPSQTREGQIFFRQNPQAVGTTKPRGGTAIRFANNLKFGDYKIFQAPELAKFVNNAVANLEYEFSPIDILNGIRADSTPFLPGLPSKISDNLISTKDYQISFGSGSRNAPLTIRYSVNPKTPIDKLPLVYKKIAEESLGKLASVYGEEAVSRDLLAKLSEPALLNKAVSGEVSDIEQIGQQFQTGYRKNLLATQNPVIRQLYERITGKPYTQYSPDQNILGVLKYQGTTPLIQNNELKTGISGAADVTQTLDVYRTNLIRRLLGLPAKQVYSGPVAQGAFKDLSQAIIRETPKGFVASVSEPTVTGGLQQVGTPSFVYFGNKVPNYSLGNLFRGHVQVPGAGITTPQSFIVTEADRAAIEKELASQLESNLKTLQNVQPPKVPFPKIELPQLDYKALGIKLSPERIANLQDLVNKIYEASQGEVKLPGLEYPQIGTQEFPFEEFANYAQQTAPTEIRTTPSGYTYQILPSGKISVLNVPEGLKTENVQPSAPASQAPAPARDIRTTASGYTYEVLPDGKINVISEGSTAKSAQEAPVQPAEEKLQTLAEPAPAEGTQPATEPAPAEEQTTDQGTTAKTSTATTQTNLNIGTIPTPTVSTVPAAPSIDLSAPVVTTTTTATNQPQTQSQVQAPAAITTPISPMQPLVNLQNLLSEQQLAQQETFNTVQPQEILQSLEQAVFANPQIQQPTEITAEQLRQDQIRQELEDQIRESIQNEINQQIQQEIQQQIQDQIQQQVENQITTTPTITTPTTPPPFPPTKRDNDELEPEKRKQLQQVIELYRRYGQDITSLLFPELAKLGIKNLNSPLLALGIRGPVSNLPIEEQNRILSTGNAIPVGEPFLRTTETATA